MHQTLSASRIKSAQERAKAEHRDLWLSDDQGTRGIGRLVIRVTPYTESRFYFRPPRAAKRKSEAIPLGLYSRTLRDGYLTLTEARERAANIWSSLNRNPDGDLIEPVSPPVAPVSTPLYADQPVFKEISTFPTLIALCRSYAQILEDDGKASAREVKGTFERYIAPSNLANQIAREIKPEAFTNLIRDVINKVSGRTGARVRSYLHAAYARAMRARLDPSAPVGLVDFGIESNPITSVGALSKFKVAGTRFLQKSELREVWLRLQFERELTIPLRGLRLCILLGGQRAEQLFAVTTRNVDVEARTILLLDSKGRRAKAREHLLPLCSQAMLDVRWLMACAKNLHSSYLFPGSRKGTALNATSMSKEVRRIFQEMNRAGLCDEPFAFIDFRRTIETMLASLGVSKDHRAQIQSHGLSGVQQKHYDRHDYMTEKLSALTLWENFLNSLLSDPS